MKHIHFIKTHNTNRLICWPWSILFESVNCGKPSLHLRFLYHLHNPSKSSFTARDFLSDGFAEMNLTLPSFVLITQSWIWHVLYTLAGIKKCNSNNQPCLAAWLRWLILSSNMLAVHYEGFYVTKPKINTMQLAHIRQPGVWVSIGVLMDLVNVNLTQHELRLSQEGESILICLPGYLH